MMKRRLGRSSLLHFSLNLAVAFAMLALGACRPAAGAPATSTSFPTVGPATVTPTAPVTATEQPPTATEPPAATATDSPPAVQEPSGVLTRAQQERIREIAEGYIALTQEEATAVAESLGYIRYASPSNMCGPLAIAILRNAGLLDPGLNLKSFWYLQPEINADTIARTFPPEKFEHFHFDTPINEFDFSAFPLKVGDLLYLYAGSSGTFEHILTVTRVDEAGRAYSVNNMNTDPKGYYVIKEVMLYDPNTPGAGQFYEWTDRKNVWIGLTGFGGFDVWRFAAPVVEPSGAERALADQLYSTFEQSGGDWYALITDANTGRRVYERLGNYEVHVASVIKIPIALLFFASLEKNGGAGPDLQSYLSTYGVQRTFAQLLEAMLVESEEDAAAILLEYITQSRLDVRGTLRGWGAPATDVSGRISTPDDIGALLAGLYHGELVSPQARQIILTLMSQYTPNDDTRLGVIQPLLPPGGVIYNKRGTLTAERLVVGDAAIVAYPSGSGEQAYIIVLFGYPGKTPTTFESLEQGIAQAARLFWQYASAGK